MITLVSAIADRLNVNTSVDAEVDELKKGVAPEAVLDRIQTGDGQCTIVLRKSVKRLRSERAVAVLELLA